jgi:hypothetical protein
LRAAVNAYHAEHTLSVVPKITLPPKAEGHHRWLTRNEAARPLSETMINLLRARRCRRSMVEDQLHHQASERCPRFRRQLQPCGRAAGVVRQAAPEQIYLMLRARSSIVSVPFP